MDSNAFPASTSLSELTNRAMIRLYPESMPQGPIPQHMIELEFYLTDCQLETHIQGDATLYDLELKGTQQSPLNIFVIRTDLKYLTTSKAYDRFGFTSSLRGVSTFVTCLKILLSQIKRKVCTLVNVLEVLWEVTHFPPALIAFRQMNDRGIETGKALPLAVLAECFYELSINMVPSWIAESPNRVLEASRQVFVWLQSLQSAISRDCSQPLVHRVEILEIPAQPDSALKARFPFSETVNLPRPKSHRSSLASRVLVSLEIENPVPPRTLALALNGLSEVPWNYFFYYPDALDLSTHKKVMAPHISEFVNLIHTANQLDSFKMVGPEQLDECPTSSLPVITLSGDGYVSTYQYEDIECSDRSFYTWNIVSGKETMPRSNPSQELLQRILPIIAVRKADLSWEIDAWSIGKIALDTRAPEESIVICVDTSSSMRSELSSSWLDINMDKTKPSPELTRLDEAKNVFKDFVTRVVAQNLPTHIGLLKFSSNSRIHVLQSLHPLVVNSEAKLNNIQDGGSTAIWDALITAEEMLVAYKKTHPTTICRIIVLTDGEDNDSYKTPSLACERLLSNQIVLDAMVLGTHSTENLFSIVKHTGGYAFKPKTRADLFRIFILESFVNIQMRPPITRIPITNWDTASPKLADMESAFDFPPHRPHPNEHDDFVNLSDARRILARFSGSVPGWSRPSSISSATSLQYGRSSPSVGASGTGRILLHEAKAMVENEHKYMEVSASESNMGFWKVWMQGPPESPYEKGVFLLYIHIGENYPTKPPEAKFITPILHPSVMKVSIFLKKRKKSLYLWSPPFSFSFFPQPRTLLPLLKILTYSFIIFIFSLKRK